MDEKEIKIIQSCQAGDTAEFGKLYDKYIKKIYDFIYYKTHHKQTAEDLTSEAFFKALRSIERFKTDAGTFQAWLYQIARNTVIDHYRTHKSTNDIEDAWDIGTTEDYQRDIDNKQLLEEVQQYLHELTSEQRDIIVMRIWDELSYSEIAEALDKSEASCRVMFSRTINKLRQEKAGLLLLLLLSSFVR